MRSTQTPGGSPAEPPILILLAINLLVGLLVFQDFGYSLDEPLYYAYGESIGYAYSPGEWFSEDFELRRAYGPSPADHGNRGPGYLLLARIPAAGLQWAGLDQASSWHLVNFLAFQVGLYFFYRFCRRWMSAWGATGATALLASQPLLWGHAFINPKDLPFLTFFLATLESGFRMAESLARADARTAGARHLRTVIGPAILLGITTNLRVIGPLAGVLVGLYYLSLNDRRSMLWFLPYGLIAYLTMVATWPFLWEAPLSKFVDVVRFMADNPTQLRVLFYGNLYPADQLPIRYLPVLMLITLTEPVWPLAAIGASAALVRIRRGSIAWRSLLVTGAWFVVPLVYVLVKRPPMYDGFRHFLFILPPVFVLAGLAFEAAFRGINQKWVAVAALVLLLLPGIAASIRLHPYQYSYYNQFVGGTGQAAYDFETDYWLTCYKEAVEKLDGFTDEPVTLYVQREYYIAAYYAPPDITVKDYQANRRSIEPGAYLLMNSRADPSLQRYRDPAQLVLRVGRDGALFCVMQRQ